jgi:hypothetical protein|tara:strand:+ start:2104 stop:2439 length:336 start_codon:yes stop_codon:yes gene_type:complete
MKVKVAYTANLEDVPELVSQLLANMRLKLEQAASKLRFNPVELEKMAHELQVVKDSLDVITSQIDDVMNMTSGWIAAIAPPTQPDEDPGLYSPPRAPDAETTEGDYDGTAD